MFQKAIKWFAGRHTMFAFLELALGTVLAWFGHLDLAYVALVGTVQGLVLGHSVKEDYFDKKKCEGSEGETK